LIRPRRCVPARFTRCSDENVKPSIPLGKRFWILSRQKRRLEPTIHRVPARLRHLFRDTELARARRLFTSLPTTVVVDHMGTPDVKKGVRMLPNPLADLFQRLGASGRDASRSATRHRQASSRREDKCQQIPIVGRAPFRISDCRDHPEGPRPQLHGAVGQAVVKAPRGRPPRHNS
jgi:hypothetical protein